MLLEEASGSTRPVSVAEPHFPVFDEFRDASYAKRYEMLLTAPTLRIQWAQPRRSKSTKLLRLALLFAPVAQSPGAGCSPSGTSDTARRATAPSVRSSSIM